MTTAGGSDQRSSPCRGGRKPAFLVLTPPLRGQGLPLIGQVADPTLTTVFLNEINALEVVFGPVVRRTGCFELSLKK